MRKKTWDLLNNLFLPIWKGIGSGEYANDKYLASMQLSGDSELVLVLTNRHLLLMKENFVFLNQKFEWSYSLTLLIGHPTLINNKITFMFKVSYKKKFYHFLWTLVIFILCFSRTPRRAYLVKITSKSQWRFKIRIKRKNSSKY